MNDLAFHYFNSFAVARLSESAAALGNNFIDTLDALTPD